MTQQTFDEQTFVEKLEKILGKEITHFWVDDDNWFSCPQAPDGSSDPLKGTECTCGRDISITRAKQAILKLIKESIPEENKSWGYGSNPQGWNSCRSELLKRWGIEE